MKFYCQNKAIMVIWESQERSIFDSMDGCMSLLAGKPRKKGITFSEMVNKFLRQELEYLGYTEGKYDAETYAIGREAVDSGSETESADKRA
jgi:hypothetical protein